MLHLIRTIVILMLFIMYSLIYAKYENIISSHGLLAIGIFAMILSLAVGLVNKVWSAYYGEQEPQSTLKTLRPLIFAVALFLMLLGVWYIFNYQHEPNYTKTLIAAAIFGSVYGGIVYFLWYASKRSSD